jgi:transcriptional regulator with XRE-family HTH domain
MASGDQPAVARRRVRIALREAREEKGLTQGQVADAMEWSLSKVMRIESGEVTIALNDLRFLLGYLEITDRSRVEGLLQDAKTSRRRQMWWDEPRLRELQTPAYAEAILGRFRDELSEDDIKVRLEVRLRRRNDLLARKPRPDILLLLDESVLHRSLGGKQVMEEQLSDLLRLAREKRVLPRVVPFTLDAPIPMLGSYDLLDLGGGGGVMYRESSTVDEIVEDTAKIQPHREIFEQLWAAAHDEATSVRLIEERVKSTRSPARKSPG